MRKLAQVPVVLFLFISRYISPESRPYLAHISPISPQVPVVLFPVGFGVEGARSIGIRAFITRDFMTGTPAMPGTPELPLEALAEIQSRVLGEVEGIARVALDISPKPPATTEWE